MKTIKVKPWADDQGDYVLINEDDFDAAKHELIDGETPRLPSGDDLASLRAEYEAKFGKRPFMGWDAKELHNRIAAA